MEKNQIGLFIRDQRAALGMTQQQLADLLGITGKAVSKWERGICYPDITLLRDLADALAVSVTELLAGEKEPDPPPAVEDIVLDTVCYAETVRKKKWDWRFWLFVLLTAGCAIGVLVLFILWYDAGPWNAGRKAFMLSIQSIAFGWAVCYPLLRVNRYPIRRALTVLTAAIVPYFWWCLGLNEPWVITIVLISAAYLWAVYFIVSRHWNQRTLMILWIGALGVCLHIGIQMLVRCRDVRALLLGIGIAAVIGAACILLDRYLRCGANRGTVC